MLSWNRDITVRKRPMLVRVDDEVIRVEPGEVVYIPRGAIHYAEAPDKGVIRYDAVVFDLGMIASSTLDACQVNVVYPILNHTRRLPIHLTSSTERLTAVLAVFFFIWTWNEFFFPLVFLISQAKQTVPLSITLLAGQTNVHFTMQSAAALPATIPPLVFFLFFQRTLATGITAVGIKG